jgi:probable F420-dependent oxidoreductase
VNEYWDKRERRGVAIRLGLAVPQLKRYDLTRDVAAVARAAQELGFSGVWVFERILFPEHPTQGLYGMPGVAWPDSYRSVADPLIALAAAAAATERVTLGTSVLVAPLHVPFQLARALATLDAVAGGRVVAGFGTGWSLDEYAASSIAPFERRGEALDELLDVCAAVWGPDPVSYQGTYTTVREAEVGPKPARPIPVFLAAMTGKALERVARRAVGWMSTGLPSGVLAAMWRRLTDQAAALGRGADALELAVRGNVRLHDKPLHDGDRRPFVGSYEQIVQDTVSMAEAGAHEVLLDLQTAARDAAHLIDLAAQLYTDVRAAGV